MTKDDIISILDRICSGIASKAERSDARDELYDHIMNHYEKNIACGMAEEEACSEAVKVLGDREQIRMDLIRAHKSTGRHIINLLAVAFTMVACCFVFPAATMFVSLVQETFVVTIIEGLMYLVLFILLFLSLKTKSITIPVAAILSLLIHFLSYGFISIVTVFFEFITGNYKNFLSDAVPGEIYSTPLGVFFKVLLTVIIIALAVFICIYNYRSIEYRKNSKRTLKGIKTLLCAFSIFVAFSTALAFFGYKSRMITDDYKAKDRYDNPYYILYADTKEEAEEMRDISESTIYKRLGRTAGGKDESFINDTYIINYHHDLDNAGIYLDSGNEDNVKLENVVEIKKSAFYIKAISRAEISIDKQSGYLIAIPRSDKTGIDNDSAEILSLPLKEKVTLHGYQNGNAQYEIILRQK